MRFEFDKTADSGRAAFADGDPHAIRHGGDTRRVEVLDAHDNTITALTLLADFDETCERGAGYGMLQNGMRDAHGLQGGNSKTAGTRGKPKCNRKTNRTPAGKESHQYAGKRQRGSCPRGRIAVGRKIGHDAEPEGD